MRRVSVLTLLLAGGLAHAGPSCTLPAGPLPTQTRAVFILDTSGSMRGIGDGKADIFGRVKAAVNRYVRGARPDQVEVVTFDTGPRPARGYTLPGEAARWNADLAALRADGRNTYLYRSVARALAPLTARERYATTVFILTDGIDNDPDARQNPARALAAFRGRGPLDTLHYVALGTQIPAAARAALGASGYGDGLTVPVGQVPDLGRLGGGVLTVRDPQQVPVPFPDGAALTLAAGEAADRVSLPDGRVTDGAVRLNVAGRLPPGTPALLCAQTAGGQVRRVLLRLNVTPAPGLTWLNPGADRTLAPGETVTLRYRLEEAADAALRPTPGLRGEVVRLPGGRELGVRLTNVGLEPGREVTPVLTFAGGRGVPLAGVTAAGGGGAALPQPTSPAPPSGPASPNSSGPQGRGRLQPWLLAGLLGLLALGGLALLLLARRRRSHARPRRPSPTAARPVPTPAPPTVEGLQYREDRTLALAHADGLVTGVSTPLGGPFDLGQVGRVPHLSGLRFEQAQGGLRVLRVPADLEVSQGARLLEAGDVIRPGTLLGVAVARPARSPWPPLGTLVGLGLPLRLRADGGTLHVVGPYGDHALTLPPGVTDLGEAFGAPVLAGLKLTRSGAHILLADVPASLAVRRAADGLPLRPGTHLPPEAHLDLPGEG
ncbi:vWA domain-containing protein [Deinococcus planocerae]|uniref:vWA domain-containing protein n=1 Tax=Deinococcus planocerae TaxID=1737569 RepID=UPI000C7EFE72|nr:vWA domain-containing protein [Deinococcus planocerae]